MVSELTEKLVSGSTTPLRFACIHDTVSREESQRLVGDDCCAPMVFPGGPYEQKHSLVHVTPDGLAVGKWLNITESPRGALGRGVSRSHVDAKRLQECGPEPQAASNLQDPSASGELLDVKEDSQRRNGPTEVAYAESTPVREECQCTPIVHQFRILSEFDSWGLGARKVRECHGFAHMGKGGNNGVPHAHASSSFQLFLRSAHDLIQNTVSCKRRRQPVMPKLLSRSIGAQHYGPAYRYVLAPFSVHPSVMVDGQMHD